VVGDVERLDQPALDGTVEGVPGLWSVDLQPEHLAFESPDETLDVFHGPHSHRSGSHRFGRYETL
jgi:hypothetical protein